MSAPGLGWHAGAQALGLLQLQADPQYPRIPPERRVALVEAALEDGRLLANRTRELWGKDPAIIAARCEIPVIASADSASFGSTIVYAEYATRPLSITLYLPAIRRLDRMLAQAGVQECLGIGETRPIFVAHELYHHFDCTRDAEPLRRQHRVRIFGFGRWNWTSGLASLAEIAAGAFAQRLLGLSFHPKLLDLLTIKSLKLETKCSFVQPC